MDQALRILQRLARIGNLSPEAIRYIAALERVLGIGDPIGDDATHIFHILLEIIRELPPSTRGSLLGMIANDDPEAYIVGLTGIERDADSPARYEFIIRAGGEGATREDAWQDATDHLYADDIGEPAFYYPIELLDEEDEDDQEVEIAINNMSRAQIIYWLEGAGIQCYDNESTDVLREALRVNIYDGTITLDL
jgi:hypothetical protein